MSTRKFDSDYSKIQTKRRIEALIASQTGAINKFEQFKIDEDIFCFDLVLKVKVTRLYIFERKMLKT